MPQRFRRRDLDERRAEEKRADERPHPVESTIVLGAYVIVADPASSPFGTAEASGFHAVR